MGDKIVIHWTFSPADYFEVESELTGDGYVLRLQRGTATCEIDPAVFESRPVMKASIDATLRDRFIGAQLVSHQPFDLSEPSVTRFNADGTRTHFVEMSGGITLGGSADVQFISNGRIVLDSKRQRIDNKLRLAEEVSKLRQADPTLRAMTSSYNQSVRDPNNELVHLYEIREALSSRFGGKAGVCKALNLTAVDWGRFGQLCNDEPLRQGRHRGKDVGALRDATAAELAEARALARQMIEAYLAVIAGRIP